MSEQPHRPRVLLHVGTPKTGTTHFQDVLFRNRESLAGQGILYPADRFDAHFLAALDLMGKRWGGLEVEAAGAWDELASRVREWPGTSIVSHEIFAAASHEQAARAMASLGDAEIHLLVSVRDLVRQIPAEWQENIKHRATMSYAKFLHGIQHPDQAGWRPNWFWSVQDLPAVLDRWAADLPPERVHLITVPPPGADQGELWRRFEVAFGLDGVRLEQETDRANPSMGAAETVLIRRVNRAINPTVSAADYRPLVRELLVHQTLSRRTTTPRLALPPELSGWAADLAEQWITELSGRGYQVIGDLDDLRGHPVDPDTYVDPDRPRERHVALAGVDAIGALINENTRLHDEIGRLQHQIGELRTALHERGGPMQRTKEAVVRGLLSNRPGQLAMRAYRRARGRSSLSA